MLWRTQNQEDIKIGDRVMSSGLVGSLPRGFPVAQVVKITFGVDEAFQKVWLKPYQDMAKLEYLFVLLTADPSLEAVQAMEQREERP